MGKCGHQDQQLKKVPWKSLEIWCYNTSYSKAMYVKASKTKKKKGAEIKEANDRVKIFID